MIDDFQVRNRLSEAKLREVGNIIKTTLPPHLGFTLLLYDYGSGGATYYMSTANREDTVALLTEFISKQNQNGDLTQ